MKSGVSVLYPNEKVAERVTNYSEAHSTALPKTITDYHAHISATHERSGYMISNFQGQAHVWLGRVIGAKRVLEIGVFVGYSSMIWSHTVGPEGKVTGLEFSPEYAGLAREALSSNGFNNVEIIVGDAEETLSTLASAEPYDIIFIDAQKSGYPKYLATILEKSAPGAANRLLRPGGLIIADNVLRRGLVADESDDNPWYVKEKTLRAEYWRPDDLESLRAFNTGLISSPRLEAWLMPLYDGVGMARIVD